MTGRELTLAAIAGRPHPRVPVAQHNFPFCVKYAGLTMDTYRDDPQAAAEALARTAREFAYDCIIIDFDTCTLAEAMGSELVFPPNEPARVARFALQRLEDVATLRVPDPHRDGRLPRWLETTRQLRRLVGNDLAIMGRADQGPFGLLFQLRDSQALLRDLLKSDPRLIEQGLRICTAAGTRFARAQLEAGADLTSIGDSAAGESLISPRHYTRFAQPYERQYKETVGPDVPVALHICGKTNNIIGGMLDTGCEVLELDHLNDLERSLRIVADRTCIFGNIDPSAVLAYGSAETVTQVCRAAIETACAITPKYVLCPGCVANANTPPENMAAMSDAARRWGEYPRSLSV
jgi:MtaA/CmuA family methyltransferase